VPTNPPVEEKPYTGGIEEADMSTVIRAFSNVERYLAIFFTSLMVLLLFMQVVSRYIFKYSFTWTEELAIICFILSVYTSASLAITRRQHLRIKILHSMVKQRTQKVLDLISNVVFAVVMLVLAKGMFVVTANLYKYGAIYIASGIPKFVVYGTIWVIFYLMVIRLIADSVVLLREYREAR
jgi:TRAP-type C4-dicarboxylate transport system permease small subunit